MGSSIAAAVHTVDPNVALADLRTLDQVRDDLLTDDGFTAAFSPALPDWLFCLRGSEFIA